MAGKIFINYRRDDERGYTQALYSHLEREFAHGDLFMDVEGHIKPGDVFLKVINDNIAASDVVLVVIGPRWTKLLAARQTDADVLMIEIKAALDQRKRIIPALVNGASMPRPDSLPETIRPLADYHAVGLRPEGFNADCQRLVAALKEKLAAAEQERAARNAYSVPRLEIVTKEYFEQPTLLPDRAGISVLFKPTKTPLVFTVITDRAERARVGPLADGCQIESEGANFGDYNKREVERQARDIALPLAEKLFRGC
jgi:TIR domain